MPSFDPAVKFTCPECDSTVHEFIEGLTYQVRIDSEDSAENTNNQHVMCSHCNNSFDVAVSATPFGLVASLPSSPDIDVTVEPADDLFYYEDEYEQYLRNFRPTHPDKIYSRSILDLKNILRKTGSSFDDVPAFYRMIFVQYFAIIEAYLCDRLINAVSDHRNALLNLIDKHKHWSDEKISWLEVLRDSSAIEKTVQEKLQKELYHNFGAVDWNYKNALGFSIFPTPDTRRTLSKYVLIRHDCVHRNGRTKEQKEHLLDQDDVKIVSDAIQEMFLHIESNYKAFVELQRKHKSFWDASVDDNPVF